MSKEEAKDSDIPIQVFKPSLIDVVKTGNVDRIEFLIRQGTLNLNDISKPDESGAMPIHYAIQEGHQQMSSWVLERMHDASIQLNTLNLAHFSCLYKSDIILNKRLAHLIYEPDSQGNTAIHYAAFSGFEKIFDLNLNKVLFFRKNNDGKASIELAVEEDQLDWLLSAINTFEISLTNHIEKAIKLNRLNIVKYLMKTTEINVDKKWLNNMIELHTQMNRIELVNLLKQIL